MKDLIIKYLTDDLTDLEHEQLLNWLKKPKNLKKFQALVKENYSIDMVYGNIDEEAALQKVKSRIIKNESPVKKMVRFYAAAAAVTLLISLTFLLNKEQQQQPIEASAVNNSIEVGTDKATLILHDGTKVALEKGKSYKENNIESNGNEIIYKPLADQEPKEMVYNYLLIPRGGQYYLNLEDGTKVWLNSESKLKYPTFFKEGESRDVELIHGEAYFEVSSSEDHGGSKFSVQTGSQKVEVLGTQFNIKAYRDESEIYTTLVEGRVNVATDSKNHALLPNQQLTLNTTTNLVQISEVKDMVNEIGWVKGEFVFAKKPLNEIMKVLSRWYDVNVIFENPSLESNKFIGHLSKNQNIEEILILIKKTNFINDYEINGKTIILK